MTLVGVRGKFKEVTKTIIEIALKENPSLIVDCSNSANPYRFEAGEESFANTYVVEAESLYRFKPTIFTLAQLTEKIDTKIVAITPYYHLFDFGNSQEQRRVIENCWDELVLLKEKLIIYIGIKNDSHHHSLSKKCDRIIEVY